MLAIRATVARTAIIFAARSDPKAIVFCGTDAANFRRRKRSAREAITDRRVASKVTLECGDLSPLSTATFLSTPRKAAISTPRDRTPNALLDIEFARSQNPRVANNAVLEV